MGGGAIGGSGRMLFGKKQTGDWTRICNGCGNRWLLPKEWATRKAPRDSQVKAMSRASRFGVGRQRERYSMQAMALQGQQNEVLTHARCASCGSSDYVQYKPGEAPA